ncbi:MAG: NADH-quinone oxidoreductase subunit L [Kineosporiaceae bacterium]|nr:NADH-quinone oxidoreductase subunit L [Kineosporiaceae bacterium]MBK7624080.1 NADH-quinone oxidoreductase subunit L [Kineosporiaceae bacterium]MBK8075835.1 NADH-quinone oxidoreductase subunit L [Kineosporiaceae bacterium]
MTTVAVLLTIFIPVTFAVVGIAFGRRSSLWAAEAGRMGALAGLAAAGLEAYGVFTSGTGEVVTGIKLLGAADLGSTTIALELRADQLSALVAVAVALVAFCVQVYSVGYLAPDQHSGTEHDAPPTRYPAYAAAVSLFTAAMMLVVHADDLILLVIGWEVMGACSYLLVGHHSERASARAAAVKAFLVTRVGDLGVLIAVVVLLAGAGTTSIHRLIEQADTLPNGTVTAAALLLLMGVAGKSAQFPLHTWLPDAMEGPTPVSALIHAATMVAAGVFLVARLLPLFLAADGALTVAAVIASITMLGAALAALAQDDLKRLLAWSTISQVAYMLAGVAVAQSGTATGPGIFHLLTHAGFKALLFLVAGCVTHLAGSTLFTRMGGLQRSHPALAGLFGLGLAALAGVPPLGGFWSKEAVLTAAEQAAREGAGWPAWVVLGSGLLTALVTGLYAARAYALVALGPAAEGAAEHHAEHPSLPSSMIWPLWLLAVPTALLGLLLIHPPALLAATHVDPLTAFTGAILSLAGIGWALSAPRLGTADIALALPDGVRAFLRDGYRLDDVQQAVVVRPYRVLARLVGAGDREVVDAYPRGLVVAVRWAGLGLRRFGDGMATSYVGWAVAGAVVLGLAGVVLS